MRSSRPSSDEPSPSSHSEEFPTHLPRYHLDLTLDTAQHTAQLKLQVTWRNPTPLPLDQCVFSFYPHYRVPQGDYIHLAKTLELLRLQPSLGIDRCGRFGVVESVRLCQLGQQSYDQAVAFRFDADNTTALRVYLPRPLNPGEVVQLELRCTYYLPNIQGRLGYWKGVTYLTNALPLLAYCDAEGWKPVPFVPWHQPWFNEAGIFEATITLPAGEVLVVPATIQRQEILPDGRQRCHCAPFVGRDFAILCSRRYQTFTATTTLPSGRAVRLRCYAFPEHEFFAREILRITAEAIPAFSRWFGDYPYDQFTIVESYFGWNGNECAGLIMIDERVFGMPHLARGYVEYLVSHETCHQWWYNLVGTNGYAEPFIDEGAAVHFTHRLLDLKHGRNNPMLEWPPGFRWLPNIYRENYRYSGVYYSIRNNEMHPAAQNLPAYGNLFGLFTGAYDRGSKVFSMIEAQLGEAAFLDFIRHLMTRYRWRILQAKELRQELEQYTGRDWGEFFRRWVYGRDLTDWEIEAVYDGFSPELPRIFRPRLLGPQPLRVVVRQCRELTEPTILEITLQDGVRHRIPVGFTTEPVYWPESGAAVTYLGDKRWQVDLSTPPPLQITIDPDRVLLDADPGNNVWRAKPRIRSTPLYTMLDETNLTLDFDRLNVIVGPWVWGPSYNDPWYTRTTMAGLRAGVNRPQRYQAGTYLAYRSDFQDLVFGADAVVLGDHWEAGGNWEWRVAGPWGRLRDRVVTPWDRLPGAGGPQRAVLYGRQVLLPTSSLYLPPTMYQEVFATYQDNFLPFSRSGAGIRWNHLLMGGYHYRWNMYTPYWDPETGFWIDVVAGGGMADVQNWQGMAQGRLELAAVRPLGSQRLGLLGQTRLAARVVLQGALPDDGRFFALGGGTLFRGFDLAERQGNALWVANLELRWPLCREVEWDILDHLFGGRNLWLATFYDVGAIYANGRRIGDVAHALGVGLRLDVAVFSFIERAVLRLDVAKTLNAATPWQIWFGVQQAF
ncbi:MAG: M1 family aminopeptidase [Gemmataceae bacterium]|nr:M1 family aminopeptidase [Gemmataceae bacterium]